MVGLKAIFTCFFIALCIIKCTSATETVCSKFSYEQEIIASVLKMKLNVEHMEKEIKKTQEDILKVLEDQREKMEMFAKNYITVRDILVVVMENKSAEVSKVLDDKTDEVDKVLKNKTAEVAKVLADKTSVIDKVLRNKTAEVVKALDDVEKKVTKAVVAFSASATKHQTNPANGQTIIFDAVMTNIGNAYDSTSGKFLAPVSGTYVFSCSIFSGGNGEFWAYMAVNNSAKAHLNERGTNGRHGMGSQTMIVQLNPGDVVTVNTNYGAGTVYGAKYSTFNGFLLL
ncbi:uncharacterized protein LOC128555619 [Mercenaria mercenaria]|uniref:uncharacterized protein LOC128555619 n=1 Tax=Mercenaria mercenaria TaxID=6596 RepID=UPI00234F4A65|nr:uncharacterized protein LOC128555619 [Mercenaria mercenaria]